MPAESRKIILRRFMQNIWNEGDFSELSQLVTPAYRVSEDEYDPWSGQDIDHETFKVRVQYSRNAFPDLNFEIREMVEENTTIAIRWVMSGSHQGDLPQLAATGRHFSIRGMTFYHFEGDRICGHTQSFDQFGFLKQVGVF